MRNDDGRRLAPEAQEERRRMVVRAIRKQGLTWSQAARIFAVCEGSISNWLKAHDKGGAEALGSRKRGRPSQPRLKKSQARAIVRKITDRCPDQLKLPFALWTRDAVRLLIRRRTGLKLSLSTVGRYLKAWGFSPQKPVRRAYEQNPKEVKAWLETEYPAIQKRAKSEGAAIYWGDEMGLRSDCQRGRSYGRIGQTPVVRASGKRFGCNMISAVSNRGNMGFMVFTERFTAKVYIEFMRRLARMAKGKVFLIVDRHPVHYRSKKVQHWIGKQDNLEVFYLPGYSPERNPDELLNNDVKNNAFAQKRPENQKEMLSELRGYLRGTQRRKDIVRNYFLQKDVAYAG
jgi:transposase